MARELVRARIVSTHRAPSPVVLSPRAQDLAPAARAWKPIAPPGCVSPAHPQVSSRPPNPVSSDLPPSGVDSGARPVTVTLRCHCPRSGVISTCREISASPATRAEQHRPPAGVIPEACRRISFPGRIAARLPPTLGGGQRSALACGARSFDKLRRHLGGVAISFQRGWGREVLRLRSGRHLWGAATSSLHGDGQDPSTALGMTPVWG